MKKPLLVLLFCFALFSSARALPSIPKWFYLDNEKIHDDSAVTVLNILPNTLRLSIAEGESREIYADVLPEGASSKELMWSLPQHAGVIEIYPHGKRCTVLGVSVGEERIYIAAESGKSASVDVEVTKAAEVLPRSFEYKGEEGAASHFTDEVMRTIIRMLITLGAALVFAAVLLTVKRRKENKNENSR